MKNLIQINHPLVKRDLSILRDKKTRGNIFRAVLRRTSSLMAYEVTRDLLLRRTKIRTPLEATTGYALASPIVLVPILRAGLGMVGGFVEVIPDARVGHIGLYRNEETLQPVDYYFKVPKHLDRSIVFVLDPMLATGGSGSAAVQYLKERGARVIRFVSVVAAPQGVRFLHRNHPEIQIYTCALDRTLNRNGYILPGLGDAGDRMFGTTE